MNIVQKTDKKGNIAYGVGMAVTCNFNESSRDIMPVIAQGTIVLTGKDSSSPKDLFRERNPHIGTTSSEKASLKANIPVSDIVEFIQTRITGLAGGVAAGDDRGAIAKKRGPVLRTSHTLGLSRLLLVS